MLDKDLHEGVQKEENLTASGGKSFTSVQEELSVAATLGLKNIQDLVLTLSGNKGQRKLQSQQLTMAQLAMLEAELQNQGILPPGAKGLCTLEQRVQHEAGMWCWRAQRLGFPTSSIDFTIDLPRYLVARVEELLRLFGEEQKSNGEPLLRASAWRTRGDATLNVKAELYYLERFASYLMGEFDDAANSYQRGLNLVLKVLRSASAERAVETDSTNLQVLLPIAKHEFLKKLKEHRERPAISAA